MKKFIIYIILTLLPISPLYADKLLKSGFLSGEWDLNKNIKVDDPKNKILIIFNHGQEDHDKPSKNCVWKKGYRPPNKQKNHTNFFV